MNLFTVHKVNGFKSIRFIAVLMLLAMMGAGCFQSDKSENINEEIYATVNGKPLTESGLMAIVPKGFYDRLTREHKKKIIEDWVNRELLFQEATQRGIHGEPDIKRLLENSNRNLLSNELLERELADIENPSDYLLKQYYDDHKEYFELQTKEYEVRYALFDNRNDALSFRRKVKRNESFSVLAEEFSKDPSSKTGGQIGVVSEESVEPALWDAIMSTVHKYGLVKISDPFMVIDGWGCVIVDKEYSVGMIKPFDLVSDLVLDMYIAEQRESRQEELIKNLTLEADIKYLFH